ncbi:MAG: cation:proton antiporter [Candidatus Roizmanbacteria bacterium]|nr:MAG: cation:proton antiporter [Candidatus Roizmanbacteria bacterium]
MGDIPASFFFNVLVFLSVPFIFAYVFKKINISPIIGYLIAGIVLGTFFNSFISQEFIKNFASFGIILLLFTIGLEINFEKILVLKRAIVVGGTIQVLLSTIAIAILSIFFKFDILQSILIGIAFASSSTALVAKIIQEKGDESSFTGELAIGLLMFQDLAFIPSIIIFASFNNQSASFFTVIKNIGIGLVEASLILGIMFYLGRMFVPLIFDKIVRSSRELLNLFIIIFIFFIGYLSTSFNVPILIGMFVAGVLVSQTLEHHHVFSQIRPFRDILAIIFFIFIGTNIQITSILNLIPSILLFSLFVVLIKSLIIVGIFLYFRFSSRIVFSLAILLFQISENAFLLLSMAFVNKIFTSQEYLFAISSVLLTLILTPLVINSKDIIYLKMRSFLKKYIPSVEVFIKHKIDFDRSPIDLLEIKNHVVICGYGRVGSHIGRALMLANIPFIAVDYNFHTVTKGKREGVPIFYGDPTDVDILDYAQVENALVLVSVVAEKYSQEAIILNAKKLNPEIFIISRVHKNEHRQRMKDLGAHIVVQPELEASLSIIKKLFLIKKLSKEDIVKKLHHFKIEQGAV